MEIPKPSNSAAFIAATGLVLDELSATRVAAHIDLDATHHTPWGVVHGGVYAAAVETTASLGASAAVEDRGQFAVGVNNTTDFLRSMKAGRVEVIAEPLQQGRVQQLWQVRITRAGDGKDVARGHVRLQNVDLTDSDTSRP
jgi:1,4-dihydroxy-2-naphthoyl-CoA hydrolase